MRIKRKAFKNNRQRASEIDVSKYEWYSPSACPVPRKTRSFINKRVKLITMPATKRKRERERERDRLSVKQVTMLIDCANVGYKIIEATARRHAFLDSDKQIAFPKTWLITARVKSGKATRTEPYSASSNALREDPQPSTASTQIKQLTEVLEISLSHAEKVGWIEEYSTLKCRFVLFSICKYMFRFERL